MTETKELRIAYTDLTMVAIQCNSCGAETVVNISDARQRKAWDDHAQFACPICRTNFDSNLKGAMIRLRDWYELTTRAATPVTFRVRLEGASSGGVHAAGVRG